MDKRDAGRRILECALPHIAFDGWSQSVLERAAEEAGLSARDVIRIFPGGPADAIDLQAELADERMLEAYAALAEKPQKIRERIATLVRLRLETIEPSREAVRRGAAYMALPPYLPRTTRIVWRTVDAVWAAAGDNATDFNWYTKRALLYGVYTSTLLYWLGDDSKDYADSWKFLGRRIDDVMQIQKWKARVSDLFKSA